MFSGLAKSGSLRLPLFLPSCRFIYALSVPNQYIATALLAPAQQESGGLSGALGQLGGLASLAGVSIGGGESSEASRSRNHEVLELH